MKSNISLYQRVRVRKRAWRSLAWLQENGVVGLPPLPRNVSIGYVVLPRRVSFSDHHAQQWQATQQGRPHAPTRTHLGPPPCPRPISPPDLLDALLSAKLRSPQVDFHGSEQGVCK